jgi:hypothetical protein
MYFGTMRHLAGSSHELRVGRFGNLEVLSFAPVRAVGVYPMTRLLV